MTMAPDNATAPRPRTVSVGTLFERFGLLLFLIVLLAVASVASPSFLNVANVKDILTQAAPLGMVVLGQTFVILVRGLDLSVASLMATVAVLATAFRATSDVMIGPIFVAAIVFSAGVGLANGWLVTKRNVSPFLATLAMMIILQGIRFAYTGGAPVSTLPPGIAYLGNGTLAGVPVNLLVLAGLAMLCGLVLHRSRLGREVYMVGSNPARGVSRSACRRTASPSSATCICSVLQRHRRDVSARLRRHRVQLGRPGLRVGQHHRRGDGRRGAERRARRPGRRAARRRRADRHHQPRAAARHSRSRYS